MAASVPNLPNTVQSPHNVTVVKSGWLMRKSQILGRWKRAWFVLYSTGRFMFYETQNSNRAEDFIHIPAQKATFLNAQQCSNIEPAEGRNRSSLFGVRTQNSTWHLCADDPDDAMAWLLSLEEARNIAPHYNPQQQQTGIPPGMQAYYPGQAHHNYHQLPPGTAIYMTQEGPILVDQQGNRVVIAHDCGGYYGGRGYGAGTGLLTGMALGSLMLWPWMMFPLFWW